MLKARWVRMRRTVCFTSTVAMSSRRERQMSSVQKVPEKKSCRSNDGWTKLQKKLKEAKIYMTLCCCSLYEHVYTAVDEPTRPSNSSTAVHDYRRTSGRSRPIRKYRPQRQILPLLHLCPEIQHGRRRFWNPEIRPAHVQVMRHLSTLTGLCVWDRTKDGKCQKGTKLNKE